MERNRYQSSTGEATWENISCVSKGQGGKLQLTVYNSSTLVSYWFCPRALDALQVLVALVYTPLGCMVKGHCHQTSDSNVWRITQGNKPADGCFLLNTDNCHVYLSPLPSPGLDMLTLASSWSSAKRKRRGLIKTNTTDVTQMKNDFKCTLYIHSHIRGESQWHAKRS